MLIHCCGTPLNLIEGAICPICGHDISIENCYFEEEKVKCGACKYRTACIFPGDDVSKCNLYESDKDFRCGWCGANLSGQPLGPAGECPFCGGN